MWFEEEAEGEETDLRLGWGQTGKRDHGKEYELESEERAVGIAESSSFSGGEATFHLLYHTDLNLCNIPDGSTVNTTSPIQRGLE